jgi:hypothetical protein
LFSNHHAQLAIASYPKIKSDRLTLIQTTQKQDCSVGQLQVF